MTIIAGFRSYDGVVICADTQETVEHAKRNVPKLRYEPSDLLAKRMKWSGSDLATAFCGAGHGPFIDKLVDEAWNAAQATSSLDEACSAIEASIKNQYSEFGQIYQPGACPEVQLIFGVKMQGRSRLFSAIGPIVNEKPRYGSGGIGHYMADFLASRMYRDHLNVRQCVILAGYILFQAKEHVDGCGGDSQIAVLRDDASSGLIDWKRVETMTDLLKSADHELADVLLRSANTEVNDDEFRDSFDLTISLLETFRRNQRNEVESWDNMFSFEHQVAGIKNSKDSLGLPILESTDESEPEK